MKNTKNKTPWWARRRLSCPDCGIVINESRFDYRKDFNCERCGVNYPIDEFCDLNDDKYSKTSVEL